MFSQGTQVIEICNKNRDIATTKSSAGYRELYTHCCGVKIQCSDNSVTDSPGVIYSFVFPCQPSRDHVLSVPSLILGVKIQQNGGGGVGCSVSVKYFTGPKQTKEHTPCLPAVSTEMVRYSKRKATRHLLSGKRC